MKRFRTVFLIVTIVSLAAVFSSCGDGDNQSGSVLRVSSTSLSSGYQDIFECSSTEGVSIEYVTADVVVQNDSTPNSPTATNSYVTIDRYKVSYAVLNMSATIPSVNGAGFTYGIEADGSTTLTVAVITEAVLEYIRSNYSDIGNGKSMQVRTDIQLWGKDAFDVTVSVTASATLEIDDYTSCVSDTEETDESS